MDNLKFYRTESERLAAAYLKLATSSEPIGKRGREMMQYYLSASLQYAFMFLVHSQSIGIGWARNRETYVLNRDVDELIQGRVEMMQKLTAGNGREVQGYFCRI